MTGTAATTPAEYSLPLLGISRLPQIVHEIEERQEASDLGLAQERPFLLGDLEGDAHPGYMIPKACPQIEKGPVEEAVGQIRSDIGAGIAYGMALDAPFCLEKP